MPRLQSDAARASGRNREYNAVDVPCVRQKPVRLCLAACFSRCLPDVRCRNRRRDRVGRVCSREQIRDSGAATNGHARFADRSQELRAGNSSVRFSDLSGTAKRVRQCGFRERNSSPSDQFTHIYPKSEIHRRSKLGAGRAFDTKFLHAAPQCTWMHIENSRSAGVTLNRPVGLV